MKFAAPVVTLIAATGATTFVPNYPVRSKAALASYLDDLGGTAAPKPGNSGIASYLDSVPAASARAPGAGIANYLDSVSRACDGGQPTAKCAEAINDYMGALSSGEAPASSAAEVAATLGNYLDALGAPDRRAGAGIPSYAAQLSDTGTSDEEDSSEDETYGLAKGTTNTYAIPGMDEMSAEEYRAQLQATISGRQSERRRIAHESGTIGNRSSNGYLDTLSAGGSGGMWKSTAAAWEKSGGDTPDEQRNAVERTLMDEVVEERSEVVEQRRGAVVKEGAVGEEQGARTVDAAVGAAVDAAVNRGGYTAPASATLGDFLIQRAIQQQLYYSAQLGNEPMVDWLKRFRSHRHLDSPRRGEGRVGLPGTYSAAFDQLQTLPFTAYLEALGTEPDSSIEVSFVKPRRRLSARERANPFLNNQPQEIEVYDQPIITSKILTQLLNTADALVETWAFHFGEAEKNDLARVASDRAAMKGLPSSLMREHALLVKGGETAYSRFTGDEPMPLYGFDCRACDRFDTLRALSRLVDEVAALTPETAFDVAYLRREVVEEDTHDGGDGNELLLKRRKARRANLERTYVTGDDLAKGAAARAAALSFLHGFCNEWVPKLVKGDGRSSLVRGEYRHAPGMKETRPADAGVDAEEAFEALWEYDDEGVHRTRGGELVLPGRLGERLRELRAAAAAESRGTLLELVGPELRKARIAYTDFVEEDSDGLGTYERFHHQAKVDGSENESYSTAAIIAEMSID